MKKYILGIDIGGTTIQVGLIDNLGNIDFQKTYNTADFTEPIDFVNNLYDYISKLNKLVDLQGVGIGAPNGNYFKGSIDYAPNLLWKGVIPLCQLFENKFKLKAVLSNDANAAAVGEELFGAGKDYKNFVLITLGTGLGSGIIIDNKILLGTNGYAGEFGHIRMIPNGRLCNCGRKGCLETYVSATGIVKTYHEFKDEFPDSTLRKYTQVTTREIFQEANNNDKLALKIIDFTAEILGNALADFACFSDPEAYVLFGGIMNAKTDFIQKIKQHMEANILQIFKNKVEIKRSALKQGDVALLGAAAVFLKEIKNT
jgi:glucokinase